jgi:hypothetical protein
LSEGCVRRAQFDTGACADALNAGRVITLSSNGHTPEMRHSEGKWAIQQ